MNGENDGFKGGFLGIARDPSTPIHMYRADDLHFFFPGRYAGLIDKLGFKVLYRVLSRTFGNGWCLEAIWFILNVDGERAPKLRAPI